MAMETAAAILTKLAFEQNKDLNSKLSGLQGKEKDVVALVMPLFRQILSELEKNRQTYDKFPSAIPLPLPDRSAKAPNSNAGAAKDIHPEEPREDHDEIGGEG